MSLEADASQPLGLLQCRQCHEEFEDARKLFRHVETVDPDRTSTCLEDMGMQMEEFRADYTRRRRKAARRKLSLGVCLLVRIFVKLYIQVDANNLLTEYKDTVKYGASFPCCICQTLSFKKNVCKVEDVEGLRTQDEQSLYVDVDLMKSNGSLFSMLDQVWICKDCRKSVLEGKRPSCSAMNGLRATWRDLPAPLQNLSIEELDTLAFTQIFCVVHELSTGPDHDDYPKKTLFLPLPTPATNIVSRFPFVV